MTEVNNGIGTKVYWEDVYKTELDNFKDHGDEGDIWFGKSNMKRIIEWLCTNNIDRCWSLIDIGCGNGVMLSSLAQVGFLNLTGVDYVQDAVELATAVLNDKAVTAKLETVDFLANISSLPLNSCMRQKYKIVVDKGTYDAIGMCPQDGPGKRENYRNQLLTILDSQGLFIVVSCNWTKEELLSHFDGLQMIDEIPTPTVMFGGKTGHTVTSLVFKKC